jgi:hypothetical protein
MLVERLCGRSMEVDSRKETIKLLLADEATKTLVANGFVDEVLQVATARGGGDGMSATAPGAKAARPYAQGVNSLRERRPGRFALGDETLVVRVRESARARRAG